jgi:outer membrane protein assembly factor BamD
MKKIVWIGVLGAMALAIFPTESPAPLVWRKGEGWVYERGGKVYIANTPQEQLAIGKRYLEEGDYGTAMASFRRVVAKWPQSKFAEDGLFHWAECLAALNYCYAAFQKYQELLTKFPSTDKFDEVLQRQFEIGQKLMAGSRQRMWKVRLFPARDKAVTVFEQIIRTGPYSEVAPQAQFFVGLTHERLKDHLSAVKAYENFLEKYRRHPLAEDAQFRIGWNYFQQAQRAEYDQGAADKAIEAFTDFLVEYPRSEKAAEAEAHREALRGEQAEGLFRIAQFYEKSKQPQAAIIYYNEVIDKFPKSERAAQAQRRIEVLSHAVKPTQTAAATP